MSKSHWLLAAAAAMFWPRRRCRNKRRTSAQANGGTLRIEAQPGFQVRVNGPNVTFGPMGQPARSL